MDARKERLVGETAISRGKYHSAAEVVQCTTEA
jgi:hypothetical protein